MIIIAHNASSFKIFPNTVVTDEKIMEYNFGGIRSQWFAIESITNEWLIVVDDG